MRVNSGAVMTVVRADSVHALPAVLDAADEMGLLVYEEPAIGWIAPSPALYRRIMSETSEMVLRDRNHPSIVLWGILNEGSCRGTPDLFGRSYVFGANRIGPTGQ